MAKNVVKIYIGSPFSLRVRLGATLFKSIVRIKGVEYERGSGFIVRDYSAIPKLNALLDRFDVELVPYSRCVICGGDVHCEGCEYREECRKDVGQCICRGCLEGGDAWENYTVRLRARLLRSTS